MITNYKTTSLTTISFTPKSTCISALTLTVKNNEQILLFHIFFCKKEEHDNQIIVDMKIQGYISNHNSMICKILHLPFEMLCYFPQIKMIPCYMWYIKNQCLILWLVPLMLSFLNILERVKRGHVINSYH